MALNSRKFFPVATGPEFRDLMLAAAASPPGAPKPTALEKFKAEHPLVAIPLQTPTSLAEEQYNGVNAFIFTNEQGHKQAVRYLAVLWQEHADSHEASRRRLWECLNRSRSGR